MGKCDSCLFYNKEFDERRQAFDDTNTSDREWHHCPMYDDERIPDAIYYDGKECEHFLEKTVKG